MDALLHPKYATIHLFEFSDLQLNWDMEVTDLPIYAAISHVWDPSDEVIRISRNVNRPLNIDTGNDKPHTISWHGLIQAAIAAKYFKCQYLWLDLLCLDQISSTDKKLQIKKMADVYGFSEVTFVMFGGVAAAQAIDKEARWIDRAWTLQEGVVAAKHGIVGNRYGLVEWDLPGSAFASGIKFTKLANNIAVVPLHQLVESGCKNPLGSASLYDVPGRSGSSEIELNLRVQCLGKHQNAISALAKVMGSLMDNDGSHDAPLWRALWVRTSKKQQDLLFSSMSIFSKQFELEVDYEKSFLQIFDSVIDQTTRNGIEPAWLSIGHKVPVYASSGLIPMLPIFTPHVGPTYSIDGKQIPAADLLCDCCQDIEFDVKFISSSGRGHLVCSQLWEVAWHSEPEENKPFREPNPAEYLEKGKIVEYFQDAEKYARWKNSEDYEDDPALESWAKECRIAISCPTWVTGEMSKREWHARVDRSEHKSNSGHSEVIAKCKYDGFVGPQCVIVGHRRIVKTSSEHWRLGVHPIVWFLNCFNGVWRKVGTGQLEIGNRRFNRKMYQVGRRHIRIAGTVDDGIEKCNCVHSYN